MKNRTQILLVNFSAAEAEQVRKAGFTVDVGTTTRDALGPSFNAPHPVHEYDIYVYNSAPEVTAPSQKGSVHLLRDPDFFTEISNLQGFPLIRIAFTGHVQQATQQLIGTSHVSLSPAHENVSVVLPTDAQKVNNSIEPLHSLLENSCNQIQLPVQQYLIPSKFSNLHPYRFVPLFINRNGDYIGAYCTSYGTTFPHYLLLPQFKNNVAILIKILEQFAELEPGMFPEYSKTNWIDEPQFWVPREKEIHDDIDAKKKEAQLYVSQKMKELEQASQEFAFIKAVLTALETADTPKPERLSNRVCQVLTFLGFAVTDIDEKIASAIRKEDLWIQDGDFIAIGEINGTQKKNPKRTEYNDLLGRMNTIFKRRDLVPDAAKITGLLILNYDSNTHPDKRPALYAGDDSDICKAAADTEIGILSTVELYKLANAVLCGTITKENARAQIKTFGLIKAQV